METNKAILPTDRWDLIELDRVTIDGTEWVVYSDDGPYTWAVTAKDYDAETTETDYSLWCSGTTGAGDTDLCRRILQECDDYLVSAIYSCGACEPIDREDIAYSYSIFDADPAQSGSALFHHHCVTLEECDKDKAVAEVRSILKIEAISYDAGDVLYAYVFGPAIDGEPIVESIEYVVTGEEAK